MKSLPKLLLLLTITVLPLPLAALAQSAEAEILATVKAINQHEIDAAKTALEKNPRTEVRDFAKKMMDAHQENLEELNAVAQELDLPVEDTAAVTAFKAKAKAKELTLKPLSGGAFEKMYIDAMVSGHEDALNKLDNDLIPQAQDEQVKEFLQSTRSSVATHLNHAKQIQSDLKSE